MDIGVPLRTLGPVDIGPLADMVASLTEDDWTKHNFRRDALADAVHGVTDNIVLKTEWHPSASTTGIGTFEDLVWVWAKERGLDPHRHLPVAREDTDLWPVFTMPDYARFADVLAPVVEQALRPIHKARGVVTRLALVRLPGGTVIAPHVDGHAMAERAHRVHVPISATPSVEYKIDGRKYNMSPGYAYDFNNRKRHSVRNKGRRDRINLFVDYYPNPGVVVRNPLQLTMPIYAPPTPLAA